MKRILAAALALLLALPIVGEPQQSTTNANFTYRLDVDSGTVTYCRLEGQNGDPFGGSANGSGRIQTTGSSASVTATVAASLPFTNIVAGDVISVQRSASATVDNVVVLTVVDGDNITVDPAVDWSGGFSWRFWKSRCGTGDSDGWISVANAKTVSLGLQYDQGNLTGGVKARWECRGSGLGALPVILYPNEGATCEGGTLTAGFCEFASASITAGRLTVVDGTPAYSSCRVGLAFVTDDSGGDAGANLERVTASVAVVR